MKKPEPKKLQHNWNFKNLYSGITDPKLTKDVSAIESAYAVFAKKYDNEKAADGYMSDSSKLKQVLADWNTLMKETGMWKPVWYLHLLRDIDSQNDKINALYAKLSDRLTKAANLIIFFNLKLGQITKENQQKFLRDENLAIYKTYLSSIFETAKYNLSEKEEKILSLKHAPAHEMWVNAQKKLLTSQTVKHKGKQIPITEAQAIKSDLPIKERRALHIELIAKYKEISYLAEAELNAVITNKRLTDELRGFTKPYEATILGYQNSVKSVEALVAAVSKRFGDSRAFFKLKAKVLGLPKLTLAEVGTKMSKSKKKYSLEEGVRFVEESFAKVKPEFAQMFLAFMVNGQFDIFPKKGKRNGAYCSGGIGVPTYIMLNHVDDMNSISTMAHEMGHAIHFELSKKQIPIYEDFTISIAEVASTFFENVLFDHLYAQASESERKTMLLEKIQDDLFTTHAQISYFNFENELHLGIKEKGQMSAEEIATLATKHRKLFLGDAFDFHANDGYFFVAVPHFRYFFYVYAYAYGQLIANALYAEYKRNPAFIEKIEYFLSAGGSKKPDDIFKDIGIDVTKTDFFEKGLDEIAAKIKLAQKLIK